MHQALSVHLKSLPAPSTNRWCLSPGSLPKRQLIAYLVSVSLVLHRPFPETAMVLEIAVQLCLPPHSFCSKEKFFFSNLPVQNLAPTCTAELLERDSQKQIFFLTMTASRCSLIAVW